MPHVTTVILAGGQGTRLHPLTIHHAKPAMFYGGRYRLIDIPISNAINSGFNQIFVIAQHLADEIEKHVHKTYRFDEMGHGSIEVLAPREGGNGEKIWFEGTADAVRKNLDALMKTGADHFLILSGDQLYNMDFQPMIQFAIEKNAELVIAALPVAGKNAERMGLMKLNQENRIIDFVEKPKDPAIIESFRLPASFSNSGQSASLGSMGIYVFQKEALKNLLEADLRHDFGYHLIQTAVKREKAYGYVFEGYWEDIGTVSSYFEANLALTDQDQNLNTYDEERPIYSCPVNLPGPRIEATRIEHSIISEGCIIAAKEISHSIIGIRCKVGKRTVIKDSVLIGGCESETAYEIGEDCIIERSIIDEKVHIGNRVKLINQKKLDHFDGKGVYIRDGIIIVTAGTTLPDDFVL